MDNGQDRFLPAALKAKRNTRKAQRQHTPPPQSDDDTSDQLVFDDVGEFGEVEPESQPEPEPQPQPQTDPRDEKIDRLLEALTTLQRENARLQEKLDKLGKGDDAPAPKKKRIDVSIEDGGIDEAKLDEEFPTLRRTVEAIARREVKKVMDALAPQLERLFDETDSAMSDVKDRTVRTAMSSFERVLRDAVPDFDALNRDAKFNEFIDGRAPMQPRGVTIRDVLSRAWNAQDVDTILEVVASFRKVNPAQPARKPGANVEQFVQPDAPRSGGQPQQRQPGKLKQSDWTAYRQKLMRGELSAADYAPIRAKFEKAKAEGRLVDDSAANAANAA